MAATDRATRGSSSPRRLGLRFRAFLFLSYGLLAVFPLVVLSVVGAELYLREQRAAPRQRLISSARAIALATDAYLEEHRRLIELTARALETAVPPEPAARDAWLARTNRASPGLRSLVLADANGRVVAADPPSALDGRPLRTLDLADRTFFRAPLDSGEAHLSGAILGFAFGADPIVVMSEPFRGADGAIVGVVGGSLDLRRLEILVQPHLRVTGTEIAVTDDRGLLVYASTGTGLELLQTRPGGPICGPPEPGPDGPPLVGNAVAAESGWRVEVCRPIAVLLAELQPKRRLAWGWVALGLGLSLGLAWLGSSLAARPVIASERRYRDLIEESFGLICTHDLDGNILSLNTAAAHALGLGNDEVHGLHLRDIVHPAARSRIENQYLETVRREGVAEGLMRVRTAQGDERYWMYRNRLVTEGDEPPFVLGHAMDVTARREAEQLLAERALRDPLTGVGNRSRFFDRLELEVDRARREGATLALLFLDLDGFKEINDTYGHATGDRVLRSVAEALTGHLRKVDTVSRLGGDEFAILLPGVGSAAHAVRIAEELVVAVGRPIRMGDAEIRPRASVGISLCPDNVLQGEALLADADRAMYEAKRGRTSRILVSRTSPPRDAET